jgi:metallo-beta-lactamase family protein
VTLFGESVQVAAQICQLQGMSGHADCNGLLQWIHSVQGVKKVFVIHGETSAADAFTATLQAQSISAYAPYSGTEFDLESGQFLREAAPVYIEKHKTEKHSASYERLRVALERVTDYVQNAKGYSNKELAQMADQLLQLYHKWER